MPPTLRHCCTSFYSEFYYSFGPIRASYDGQGKCGTGGSVRAWRSRPCGWARLACAVRRRPDQHAQNAQHSGLETVIVTARKRAENAQAVPISITAFNQDELTSSMS